MVGPSMLSKCNYNLTLKSSATTTIKFLCSYGGKIVPRYPDGKLRYHGGETRVLAVERSISFSELVGKLGEMCRTSVSLRCQLPTEDMDALVSITSDEDLANLIEEYDRAAASASASASASGTTISALKIRAFLSPPKSTTKKLSPSPSIASSSTTTTTSNDATSPKSPLYSTAAAPNLSSRPPKAAAATERCIHQIMSRPAVAYPHPLISFEKATAKGLPHQYGYYGPGKTSSHIYLIHHGNHWQ